MRRRNLRLAAPFTAAIVTALALGACSGGSDPDPGTVDPSDVDTEAPVTISVGGMPSAENAEQLANFESRVEEFTAEHPNITIEGEETLWEASTFQALLAGGTMPTVMQVPFTEIGALMARGQVADITDYIDADTILGQLNPSVMDVVTDADARVGGVPIAAYTMGLLYNRSLFEEAGLDPDDPPQTWDDVRTAAQAISEQTDAQGFATMTLDNTGGWVLTTTSYGFGSTVQSDDGTTATVDNPATAAALEFYRTLRWEDDSMGSNFLLNYDDAANAFAAGQVGMFVQGADQFTNVVVNLGMDQDDFGLAPLPQTDDGLGTLGGGTVEIISPKATPEEVAAALEWISYFRFRQYTDEEIAVSNAEARAADGLPVGAPGLPVVNADVYEQYSSWVKPFVDVPRENYELYLSTVETLPLVPEPSTKAQEIYAILDPVVQAVLTRDDADIEQLLADAQASAQAAIDAG